MILIMILIIMMIIIIIIISFRRQKSQLTVLFTFDIITFTKFHMRKRE